MEKVQIDMVLNKNHYLINQIYKLLPSREEGAEWRKPLQAIVIEILGVADLLDSQKDILFSLACKLQGLLHIEELQLDTEEEFALYRRTIFECLSLCGTVKETLEKLKEVGV